MRAASLLLTGLLLGLACGGGGTGPGVVPPPAPPPPPPPAPGPNMVNVQNNEFNPASLTVPVGTEVTFNYLSTARQHNILPSPPATRPSQPTVRDGPFTHRETFNTAGTFRYYCSVHGDAGGGGMAGRIIVQ